MPKGFVKVYNSLPYPVEFQFDSDRYKLVEHAEEFLPVHLAREAVQQSRYKILRDGTPLFGVIVEGFAPFEPLTEEDLHLDDPILGNQIEFENPEELRPLKVSQVGVMPSARKRVDSAVQVQAVGAVQ